MLICGIIYLVLFENGWCPLPAFVLMWILFTQRIGSLLKIYFNILVTVKFMNKKSDFDLQ